MVKISDLKKLCYRSYSFDLNDYYQMISHGQGGLFFDIPEMVGNMGLKTFSSALCRWIQSYPMLPCYLQRNPAQNADGRTHQRTVWD